MPASPGDIDLIPCPGPGEPHFLAVPKWPPIPWYPVICEKCHGAIRITEELRARAVKS